MKILKILLKRFIYSVFLLYGYNLISIEFNLMLPINIYTICIISFLGPCGFVLLVLFKYLIL
ncbi:MAG: pro-sigmaK processing inhibitor BofA family protein [Bacilli bacterium]|nr:pro-sigmaK processing inhibitor BofA family protein [Bacilli bacterium]